MRYRTKLAGMKDMAKMTQMATTASTDVVNLERNGDIFKTENFPFLNVGIISD